MDGCLAAINHRCPWQPCRAGQPPALYAPDPGPCLPTFVQRYRGKALLAEHGWQGIEPPLLLSIPEIFQKSYCISYCRLRPKPLNFSPSGPSTKHTKSVLDEAGWRSINFDESSIFSAEPSEILDGFCVMVAKSYKDAFRVRWWCNCAHDLPPIPIPI